MKKGLLMLGVAVLALASCTNEEVLNVSDSRAIGFTGTSIDNITKADITSTDFAQFNVYGGYTTKDKPVFENISVTKDDESGQWSYSPAQYWVAGTWNFAGYAGGNSIESKEWANETGVLTLEVNSDATHQNDVIFATSKKENAKGITVSDPATYTTPVSLNFTHLLSKIQFKFTKEEASLGGVTVKLTGFKVSGLTTKGKWIDDVQTEIAPATTGDYTDFAEAQEIDQTNGAPTAEFYVIPQNVTTFAIEVMAEVTDVNGTLIKKGKVTANVPTSTIKDWAAQTKYVYTAELKNDNIPPTEGSDAKPIEFTGSASDWTTGGQTDPITPQP